MIGRIFGDMKIVELDFKNKARKKVKVQCQVCGYERWMSYYSLLEGQGNSHLSCSMHFSRTLPKEQKEAYKKFKGVFYGIQQRCNYPQHIEYKRYGAKGIKCEFFDLMDFINKMWKTYRIGLSIDRIDNTKNYNLENCRWVTAKQQAINRRTTIPIRSHNLNTGNERDWKCLADFLRWLFGDAYRPGYGTHAKRCMLNSKPYKGYMLYSLKS